MKLQAHGQKTNREMQAICIVTPKHRVCWQDISFWRPVQADSEVPSADEADEITDKMTRFKQQTGTCVCMQVWEGYVPEVARATANGDAEEAIPSSSGQVSVTVTEMADANTIYIQVHYIDTLLCGAPLPVETECLSGCMWKDWCRWLSHRGEAIDKRKGKHTVMNRRESDACEGLRAGVCCICCLETKAMLMLVCRG